MSKEKKNKPPKHWKSKTQPLKLYLPLVIPSVLPLFLCKSSLIFFLLIFITFFSFYANVSILLACSCPILFFVPSNLTIALCFPLYFSFVSLFSLLFPPSSHILFLPSSCIFPVHRDESLQAQEISLPWRSALQRQWH